MASSSNESRIIIAIDAIKRDPKLTVRKAARIYNVSRTTLHSRRAGRLPRGEKRANSMKLIALKENVILEQIINLVDRGFPPRLEDKRDIADRLLGV